MDKNAIKKYAVWARRELIERVSQRAMFYGVSSQSIGDPDAAEVHGRLLSPVEKKQRQALIRKVREKGFDQIMEEVAYTWFNRFAALRFMEVNGYLPSLVRVFTNEAGEFKPQILSEALHLELEGLDKQKVLELESGNKSEELFRYLLIVQCNALNSILPGMFQKIEDYTELLLPDNLLRDGSVIEQLISCIPEADWTDQVQIIGWLYQYYNTEPKDKVFTDLKKNIKISKENIPAATQLFTPDWIVHYMVENSLGRLWLEGHPNDALKSEWKYYLDEAEQEPEVQAQLAEIWKEYAALKPEEIRVIDPCCGSGHILVVMFDVLVQIYEDYGYTAREAAVKIVENNLWGLDIDERAAQLSYFAVMMKARQYDRRFFSRGIQPHVYDIVESNGINTDLLEYFAGSDISAYYSGRDVPPLLNDIVSITNDLRDAKEFGSIINVHKVDFDALFARFEEIHDTEAFKLSSLEVLSSLLPVVQVGQALAQKYHVVVTNPPYMGGGGMSPKLSEFVKKHFPDSKSDLFAVFIEQCGKMMRQKGYQAMITQHAWMFLSSYEKFRGKLQTQDIVSLAHLGIGTFEDLNSKVVQSVSFVIRNTHIAHYKGNYDRLFEKQGVQESNDEKQKWLIQGNHRFIVKQDNFSKIPGAPIAYWVSDHVTAAFASSSMSDISVAKCGMGTSNNARFLRLWFEPSIDNIGFTYRDIEQTTDCKFKWIPYDKGGDFRKWYGNQNYVVNFYNNAEEIREATKDASGGRVVGTDYYFKTHLSWSSVTTSCIAFRYFGEGFIFDSATNAVFLKNDDDIFNTLGYLNCKFVNEWANIINPTINFTVSDFLKLPSANSEKKSIVERIVRENIEISKKDWDAFESSWEFQRHPMIPIYTGGTKKNYRVESLYHLWEKQCENRFQKMKYNEEELNRIFIDIYGLRDELTPEVEDKNITVHRADLQRDIRSLISYAVGCMFGRYSLDTPGLVFAGGVWNVSKYKTFFPDRDAIIPICDDDYFEDDIVGRFVEFVEEVYGKESLEENLRFIANALGGKGSSRYVIRNYFLNDFYADHCTAYSVTGSGKRPIYWLFDSGKKNGFKCLIYMHRYQPDTIARIRTDYVHEQQSRYRTAIADLEHRVDGATPSERVKLNKQLSKVRDQAEELRVYEEKIHHLADQMIDINLDDGVKHNYSVFKDVLAKI